MVNSTGFVTSEEEVGRSLGEVLEMSTTLTVVMVSSVFAYAQTHQDLHIKCMQLSISPLYLNKTIWKRLGNNSIGPDGPLRIVNFIKNLKKKITPI